MGCDVRSGDAPIRIRGEELRLDSLGPPHPGTARTNGRAWLGELQGMMSRDALVTRRGTSSPSRHNVACIPAPKGAWRGTFPGEADQHRRILTQLTSPPAEALSLQNEQARYLARGSRNPLHPARQPAGPFSLSLMFWGLLLRQEVTLMVQCSP